MLALPHHLGLGGCVQAGYKLAYELGYDYVIRVDGDGQHDPRDIPRLLETLRRVELRDGDRLAICGREREHATASRGRWGSASSGWCCGRFWASRCTTRPRASWA